MPILRNVSFNTLPAKHFNLDLLWFTKTHWCCLHVSSRPLKPLPAAMCVCSVPLKNAYSIITLWWCVTVAALIKYIDHCLSVEHGWSCLTHYLSKNCHIVRSLGASLRLDPKSTHNSHVFHVYNSSQGDDAEFGYLLTPSVSTAALRLPSLNARTTGGAQCSRPLLWCCLHAMQMIGKQTALHRATLSPRPSLQPMQISAHRALGSHEAGN